MTTPSESKSIEKNEVGITLLHRERILAALAASLTQSAIDAAAEEVGNTGTPAEVIGLMAILATLRDSRTEAGNEAEEDGFTGETAHGEAEHYEAIRGELLDRWQ